MTIPADWLPALPRGSVNGIVCHWTAGAHTPTAFDRQHYHILFDGAGNPVRGVPRIEQNCPKAINGYAAHTLGCNSGRIGVSLACMAGATPKNFGKHPMTRLQWTAMVQGVAQICKRYGLAVTPQTVLSHAEAFKNLGRPQLGKWDFTVLPFESKAELGAKVVGDRLRAEVSAALANLA